MKHINLVIFASILHDGTSVMNSRKQLFENIRSFAEVEIIYPTMLSSMLSRSKYSEDGDSFTDYDNIDFREKDKEMTSTLCFIATGGTEEIFKSFINILPKPIIILSDGLHNSLAAAFEICTFLKNNGIENTLLNAPLDNNPVFFKRMEKILFSADTAHPAPKELDINPHKADFTKSVLHYFSKAKIGLIGGESPWLISSKVDTLYIEKKYDVKFLEIPISELEQSFNNIDLSAPEIKGIVSKMEQYLIGGRTKEDLEAAAGMYVAIKNICIKYELKALTIKCFSILDSCRTTACLALSLLNDEGIISGCEGDIQTLWSMMYCYAAYSKCSFMANPSSSNKDELTVDFSHCTIPLSIVHGFRLPSHFESSSGIAISGSVPCGKYNLIKFSGLQLERFYLGRGIVIMNTNIEQRCRTQIRFKFNSADEFDNFMNNRSGNHFVLVSDE
ncbi:MAG: hypothetical protein PHD11_06590 [Bacteroidales bacterium]|nr:hypothetical protein [Bacteroidales bacterium]